MEDLKGIMTSFNQISLKDLDAVRLMNRTDTKFVVSKSQLKSLLTIILSDYSALNVDGINLSHYTTLYYDTPDFQFYQLHHNGKKNRKKVRFRKYVDSNLCFLEVKHKDNKSRTDKRRTVVPDIEQQLSDESKAFLSKHELADKNLEAKLWNDFHRITLADKSFTERVTIDTNMKLRNEAHSQSFPNIAIIEVKQPKYDRMSPIMATLKKLRIRPMSMSKYCLGIALLENNLKTNNFKQSIRFVQHIS